MCLNPQIIKNVNATPFLKNTEYAPYFDTQSYSIAVPCGHCASCIALKQNYIVQRVQMESKDNLIFMGMYSYNNETLPCINVNGYPIKYANIRHVQDTIRFIRKWESFPKFRYMFVSEFGSSENKTHRPHFHFFIFFPKSYFNKPYDQITLANCESLRYHLWHVFLKYWRHNIGTRKNPIWVQNLTFRQVGRKRNYDFQYVDCSQDFSGAAFYCSKYVTKFSDYVDRLKSALYFNTGDDFHDIWKKVKPKFLYSKGFGNPDSELVRKHIRLGIDIALDDENALYPYYFSSHNGSLFPLAPYYREKFLTADESLIFKERLLRLSETGVISDLPFNKSVDQIEESIRRFEKVKSLLRQRDSDSSLFLNTDSFNLDQFISSTHGKYEIQANLFKDFESSSDWEDFDVDCDNLDDYCDSLF